MDQTQRRREEVYKKTQNVGEPVVLDMPNNMAYNPQITQNSDVVFLADKVWQGCGKSSVDINLLGKHNHSRGASIDKDKLNDR